MQIIKPTVELIKQAPGIEGIYEAIARAGRICYASNKKDKNKEFVERLIQSSHFRPLEFGTVYLSIPYDSEDWQKYKYSSYSKIYIDPDNNVCVTTNYRVLVEGNLLSDLKYLVDTPTKYHFRRYTFHWTIARSIADEMRTHTTISSLMESTRYCGYNKEKFGKQLTFIRPVDWTVNPSVDRLTKVAWKVSEIAYKWLIYLGARPQQARRILPLDIKTEFIQCGFTDAWDNFFNQRYFGTTGTPHPDCKQIAEVAYNIYYGEKNKI